MIPLVDIHCHLLAGLDDGPRTMDDAIEMCHIAWQEGIRVIAATVHIAEPWPHVTPDRIHAATGRLVAQLKKIRLPLTVYPCAEVRVRHDLEDMWSQGKLLSMADRGTYLLIELPTGVFLDLREMVRRFGQLGVRLILAHPERHAELLHETGCVEQLIRLGCLVQVSSDSITDPPRREDRRALRRWVRQGTIHLIGSDGHSPRSRPPRMAEAYRCVAGWAGADVADRICSISGMALLEGLPVQTPRPEPAPKRRWFPRLW